MSCFNKYYYQLQECGTTNIYVTSYFDLRKYENGCVFLDQLSGTCYELIGIEGTTYSGPEITFQTSSCLVYKECEDCLTTPVVEGCTKPNACNYDPCATVDDLSCAALVNIDFKIRCLGTLETCAEPSCTT